MTMAQEVEVQSAKFVTRYEVLYKLIASTMVAFHNCVKHDNSMWENRHRELLTLIEREILPRGSGIDAGCQFDYSKSNEKRIVIDFSFHHMDSNGMYCGWEDYTLTITPSFSGIDLRITGKNKNDIKEYLYQTFDYILSEVVKYGWNTEEEEYSIWQKVNGKFPESDPVKENIELHNTAIEMESASNQNAEPIGNGLYVHPATGRMEYR
jgi:hypothetical protein